MVCVNAVPVAPTSDISGGIVSDVLGAIVFVMASLTIRSYRCNCVGETDIPHVSLFRGGMGSG